MRSKVDPVSVLEVRGAGCSRYIERRSPIIGDIFTESSIMKLKAICHTILLLLVGISLLHAEEDIPGLIKKLDTLPPDERAVLFGSLPQETKDAIAEVRREDARRFRKAFDAAEKKKDAIFRAGAVPLGTEVVMNYRYLANKVVEEIPDSDKKQKTRKRTLKKAQEMAYIIGEAPGPLVIPFWEKNREKIAEIWKPVEWDKADVETLHRVEEAFKPILQELQEISAAEPEQDKPWWLRQKWRHLVISDDKTSE